MAFDHTLRDMEFLDAELTTAASFTGRAGADAAETIKQRTLKNAISCTGVGLHSGKKVTMTLQPAPADSGIVFRRTDIRNGAIIPALFGYVKDSRLCTVIGNGDGNTVATIEHLMAALAAMAIDNVVIEIDGPEVPAMDGSAAPFVFLVECAGTVELARPRTAWRVKRAISVAQGQATAALSPAAAGLSVEFEIEFAAEAIGRQVCSYAVDPHTFKDAIMSARTFGLVDDIPKMRQAGLALGGSLDNAVVVNGAEVLNEGGLRYPDEFVRHKALDAIGDLALAGKPIIGRYVGIRSSHALNTGLLQTMFADRASIEEVVLTVPAELPDPLMMRASA